MTSQDRQPSTHRQRRPHDVKAASSPAWTAVLSASGWTRISRSSRTAVCNGVSILYRKTDITLSLTSIKGKCHYCPGQYSGWTLCASSCKRMPRDPCGAPDCPDNVADIAASVVRAVELEPGGVWRSFPAGRNAEVDGMRQALELQGACQHRRGQPGPFHLGAPRRSLQERLYFLAPQLHAAHRVGPAGIRVRSDRRAPNCSAWYAALHALDLVLYEEIQGQQVPGKLAVARHGHGRDSRACR